MEEDFNLPNDIPECLKEKVSLKKITIDSVRVMATAFSNFHKQKADGKRSRPIFLTSLGIIAGDIVEIADKAEPRKTDMGFTLDIGTYLYHARNAALCEREKGEKITLTDIVGFVHLKNVTFISLTNIRSTLDELILFTDQILGMAIESVDTE